jgi:hypothetical protein
MLVAKMPIIFAAGEGMLVAKMPIISLSRRAFSAGG